MSAAAFGTEIFSQFNDKWALLSAGTKEDFNAMTIRWGGLGTLWCLPVVTVYVKPIRFTWVFMEKYDRFTVSFYSNEYKDDLAIMGRKSGRDCNKVALTRLTAKELECAVTFEQADVTLLCRKIYWQDLNRETMPRDVIDKYYTVEEPHRMYIGQVLRVIRN